MLRRRDERLWVSSGAVLFLALFSLFVRTHAASLYLDDSGETVTVAALLGIGHPPGYPLHSLLAHAWLEALPLGALPARLNLLASLCGALSAAGLYLWLSRGREAALWAVPAAAAALYAAGPVFWHNALGAKGSIYQLNNLFSVALLALLCWEDELSLRRLRAFWLLFGLSLAHHYMSQAPLIPAYAWLLWQLPGEPKRGSRLGPAWLAIPGASLYAYLFIRSAQDPGLNWGAIHSLRDFWFFFFRLQYAAGELTRSAGGTGAQCWHAFKLLAREGSFVLLPLAAVSAWALRRRRPAQALSLAWLFSVLAVGFYLNLATERLDLMKPYLFPAYLAQTSLAISGLLHFFGQRRWRRRSGALLAVPLLSIAFNFRALDLSDYHFAEDNARNILLTLPPNALTFAQGDAVIFPLWYEQRVLGLRPDVAVVGNAVLPMDWVRQDLQRRFPDLRMPTVTGPIGAESVDRLVLAIASMNLGRRPLYTLYNKLEPPMPGWRLDSEGLSYHLVPATEPLPKEPGAASRAHLQAAVIRGYARRPLDARTLKLVVGDFAIHHNAAGVADEEAGRFESAKAWYVRAAAIDPESPEYYFNAGNALNAMKRLPEAIDFYRRSLAVDPDYEAARYNLAVTQYQSGQRDAAIASFRELLKRSPRRQDVQQLLQQLGAGPV